MRSSLKFISLSYFSNIKIVLIFFYPPDVHIYIYWLTIYIIIVHSSGNCFCIKRCHKNLNEVIKCYLSLIGKCLVAFEW